MANTMTARKDRRSWWQRFWRVAAQPAQPVSVGMDGLPAGVGVLPVGAPAVLLAADEASSQVWGPLVLQSLLAAGLRGGLQVGHAKGADGLHHLGWEVAQ